MTAVINLPVTLQILDLLHALDVPNPHSLVQSVVSDWLATVGHQSVFLDHDKASWHRVVAKRGRSGYMIRSCDDAVL